MSLGIERLALFEDIYAIAFAVQELEEEYEELTTQVKACDKLLDFIGPYIEERERGMTEWASEEIVALVSLYRAARPRKNNED